jgi:hypothetical protein
MVAYQTESKRYIFNFGCIYQASMGRLLNSWASPIRHLRGMQ